MTMQNKSEHVPYLSTLDCLLAKAQHNEMPTINQPWFQDRLKAMRISQRRLAKLIGLDPAAVSNLLNGKRYMSMDEAKLIAEHLLVPVTEVMRQAGIDVTDDVRKVPIAGYISTGSTVTLLPKGTHDLVNAPADVPAGSFAIQSRIVSSPYDGWLCFVSGQQQLPDELIDKLCVLALTDGRMLCAAIKRGYKQGHYNLVLMPDPGVLENKQVAWAARVLWILPS